MGSAGTVSRRMRGDNPLGGARHSVRPLTPASRLGRRPDSGAPVPTVGAGSQVGVRPSGRVVWEATPKGGSPPGVTVSLQTHRERKDRIGPPGPLADRSLCGAPEGPRGGDRICGDTPPRRLPSPWHPSTLQTPFGSTLTPPPPRLQMTTQEGVASTLRDCWDTTRKERH